MLWKIILSYCDETVIVKSESKRKVYIHAIGISNTAWPSRKVDLNDPALNPLSEEKLEEIIKSLEPRYRGGGGIFIEPADDIVDLDERKE